VTTRGDSGPTREYSTDVETETVAGVAVPASCRDRVDDESLRAAVDALDAHDVVHYQVTPVGGLRVYVGVYRSADERASLRRALEGATHGVREQGVSDGFRCLRAALADHGGPDPPA
jgi:hypothetical protein